MYQRAYARGLVLVNPTGNAAMVTLPGTMKRVIPSGGGPLPANGMPAGTNMTATVGSISVPAHGAEILLQ